MEPFVLKDAEPGTLVPAKWVYLVIESHGSNLFGRLLLPAFHDNQTRCPIALVLHGHPGGDRNEDIALALQANGFAVVMFSYRGIWGSQGDYALSHNIEDTLAVADYVRKMAQEYRMDPDRLYLFGHSMGGFSALNAIVAGLKVSGAVLLAPCDTGYKYLYDPAGIDHLMARKHQGYFHLASENAMEEDIAANAEKWYFPNLVSKLDKTIPYHFIGGTQDQTTPPEQHIKPLLAAMETAGFDVQYTELDDGHAFSRYRASVAHIAFNHFQKA